jgi:adenylosuccinate synthase
MSNVEVVVGGQYGSEGKGHVTAQIVKRAVRSGHQVLNIRVAGPNAGHTVIDALGRAYPLRQIPVGAVLSGGPIAEDDVTVQVTPTDETPAHVTIPDVVVAIAPGSEVDLGVLQREYDQITESGHNLHLVVAGEATMIEDKHKVDETSAELVARVGSTGKGIGAARADRIFRVATRFIDDPEAMEWAKAREVIVMDADQWDRFIEQTLANKATSVVIEGTQGYGLGLRAGHYPQVTSSDTRALDFLAMAGVNPWACGVDGLAVWVCARVYPIRVAGNSGPLRGETTWEALGLPAERTTVTHKVRRVGEWDADLVRRAVRANGGHHQVLLALTMVDQMFPEVKETEVAPGQPWPEVLDAAQEWADEVTQETGASLGLITTGPNHAVWAI